MWTESRVKTHCCSPSLVLTYYFGTNAQPIRICCKMIHGLTGFHCTTCLITGNAGSINLNYHAVESLNHHTTSDWRSPNSITTPPPSWFNNQSLRKASEGINYIFININRGNSFTCLKIKHINLSKLMDYVKSVKDTTMRYQYLTCFKTMIIIEHRDGAEKFHRFIDDFLLLPEENS